MASSDVGSLPFAPSRRPPPTSPPTPPHRTRDDSADAVQPPTSTTFAGALEPLGLELAPLRRAAPHVPPPPSVAAPAMHVVLPIDWGDRGAGRGAGASGRGDGAERGRVVEPGTQGDDAVVEGRRARAPDDEDGDEDDEDETGGAAAAPAGTARASDAYTPYLAMLTAIACLGGLQFGWDTGMASGMLVAIHEDLGHALSAGEQELIVSATTVGALVGALVAGRLSDWLGRKKVMVASGILFFLGSLEQSASQVTTELVMGRFIVGLGVGAASTVTPLYLAEVAPPSIRGPIVAANSLLITGGQVVAYVIDALLYPVAHGWRLMVLAGAVPAAVQLVGLLWLDESPRWLVANKRYVEARRVLQRVYPTASAEQLEASVDRLERSVRQRQAPGVDSTEPQGQRDHIEPAPSMLHKPATTTTSLRSQLSSLRSKRSHRRALLLACGLQASQQLIGANSLLYFSSRLLLMAGLRSNPNSAAIGVAAANFVGTLVGLRLVDRWGRRRLLLWTTAAATLSLACLAAAFGAIDVGDVVDPKGVATTTTTARSVFVVGRAEMASASLASSSMLPSSPSSRPPALPPQPPPPTVAAWICVVSMVAFLFFYAPGLGLCPWILTSELFSGPVRGLGTGLAVATNWITNLLLASGYLHFVKLVTAAGSFWTFTGVGVTSWLFIYYCLPETAGASITEIETLLASDDPVALSTSPGSAWRLTDSTSSPSASAGYAPVSANDIEEGERGGTARSDGAA